MPEPRTSLWISRRAAWLPRNDPRNPWTTRNLLPHFIELDNRVFERFSAEERKNIGVHVCPGGDVDSVHSADVPYEELLKHLFKLNAGYFQLQMASERDREAAYKLVGQYLREDANGIPQMAYIGCIVTQSPRPSQLRKSVINSSRRQITLARTNSDRQTIAGSHPSALTKSLTMGIRITREISRFRKSPTA